MCTAAEIERAAQLIRTGRLVVFPTETVYGLGANALDAEAVARIFEAKRRPKSSPLIVHCASKAMARRFASEWPEAADQLADRFWPGPLTIVTPKVAEIPDLVTAGLGTVGLRVPNHPVALGLIEAAGVPIAAPSANRFTRLSPTEAAHIEGIEADCVLDAGPSQVGIESTVVSVSGPVRILRPGMIGKAAIEGVAGPVEAAVAAANQAPGLHPVHYQPRTPLKLIRRGQHEPGRGIVIAYSWAADLTLPSDPAGYAAALYERLHRADAQGFEWIGIEPPPETEEWEAVWDRLRRAVTR